MSIGAGRYTKEEELRNAFSIFDKDGNGQITKEEFGYRINSLSSIYHYLLFCNFVFLKINSVTFYLHLMTQ